MRLRWIAAIPAAAVLAAAGSAQGGKAPARTLSVSPRQQFVTLPVRITGEHWPRGPHCPGSVQLTYRESGRTHPLGRRALRADGSFARTWTTPRGLGGMTVRVLAVETCGAAGAVRASTTVRILPTP
jgi:hypothetical protein